jgi:hypothetical protein
MKKVSELNGLEFAELLHEVCERLERENQTTVCVHRPKGNCFYLVNSDHEKVFGVEEHTEKGNYFSVGMAYVSSYVKIM